MYIIKPAKEKKWKAEKPKYEKKKKEGNKRKLIKSRIAWMNEWMTKHLTGKERKKGKKKERFRSKKIHS